MPQVDMLDHKKLSKLLTTTNFYPFPYNLDLWMHRICEIQFVLVVDDFDVKYVGKDNTDFLIDTLQK